MYLYIAILTYSMLIKKKKTNTKKPERIFVTQISKELFYALNKMENKLKWGYNATKFQQENT